MDSDTPIKLSNLSMSFKESKSEDPLIKDKARSDAVKWNGEKPYYKVTKSRQIKISDNLTFNEVLAFESDTIDIHIDGDDFVRVYHEKSNGEVDEYVVVSAEIDLNLVKIPSPEEMEEIAKFQELIEGFEQ